MGVHHGNRFLRRGRTSRSLREVEPLGADRESLGTSLDDLRFSDRQGTPLYDAIALAYDEMRERAEPGRINAIVVLSDGQDTDSSMSLDSLHRQDRHGRARGRRRRTRAHLPDRLRRGRRHHRAAADRRGHRRPVVRCVGRRRRSISSSRRSSTTSEPAGRPDADRARRLPEDTSTTPSPGFSRPRCTCRPRCTTPPRSPARSRRRSATPRWEWRCSRTTPRSRHPDPRSSRSSPQRTGLRHHHRRGRRRPLGGLPRARPGRGDDDRQPGRVLGRIASQDALTETVQGVVAASDPPSADWRRRVGRPRDRTRDRCGRGRRRGHRGWSRSSAGSRRVPSRRSRVPPTVATQVQTLHALSVDYAAAGVAGHPIAGQTAQDIDAIADNVTQLFERLGGQGVGGSAPPRRDRVRRQARQAHGGASTATYLLDILTHPHLWDDPDERVSEVRDAVVASLRAAHREHQAGQRAAGTPLPGLARHAHRPPQGTAGLGSGVPSRDGR